MLFPAPSAYLISAFLFSEGANCEVLFSYIYYILNATWKSHGLGLFKYSPSIGIVRYCLREDLAAPHIFNRKSKPLSIFNLGLIHDGLYVGLLNFTMLCPYKFSTCVHGHGRFFSTQLDKYRAFVVAQGHVVGPLQAGDSPNALKSIVKSVFESVRIRMPDTHGAIFGASQYDW